MTSQFKRWTLPALCAATIGFAAPHTAWAGKYKVLYDFAGGADGAVPTAPIVQDATGLIYGTTQQQGSYGRGTLYSFNPATGAETPLYEFSQSDGYVPVWITVGPDGAIYGAMTARPRNGALFKFDPATSTYTVLISFINGSNPVGIEPISVAVDKDGTVFGQNGENEYGNGGSIYRIQPHGKAKVLLSFTQNLTVGPMELIRNTLYFVTCVGEHTGALWAVPTRAGTAHEVYQFTGQLDGGCPAGNVVGSKSGMIYGVTLIGGSNGHGVLYQIDPASGAETVLYNFDATTPYPPYSLTMGAGHTIYAVTGGDYQQGGVEAFDTVSRTFKFLGGKAAAKAFANIGPDPGLVVQGNAIYGTNNPYQQGYGTIFKVAR